MKRTAATIAVFLSLLSPALADAAGIEVTPAQLTIKTAPGKTADGELEVRNPTVDVQVFEVYPDNFAESLAVEPQSFTLEAGTKKTVKVILRRPLEANQKLQTDISVVTHALSTSALQANSGIKIPLTVEVGQKSFFGIPRAWFFTGTALYAAVVLIFVSAVRYYFWQIRKSTQQV